MQIAASGDQTASAAVESTDGSRRPQGISSAHFLKLVEERGDVGFWSSDFATGRVTTSFGFHRLFGVDPVLNPGCLDLMELIHPDDKALHEDMSAAVRSGQAIDREFRIIRPDGTVRWIRNKAEAIVDGAGLAVRAVGAIFDITTEREARASAERGVVRYRTLMTAIAAATWKADRNGAPEVTATWCDLTGQTREQASGLGWLDAVHPEERGAVLLAWKAAVATRGIYEMDHRIRCADGHYRWLNARAAPVLDLDGTVREWVGVILKEGAGKQDRTSPRSKAAVQRAERLQAVQIRAARAMLNWSLEDLAEAADVSMSSVRRMESDMIGQIRQSTIDAARRALEQAGVEFTFGEGGQPGIKLR